MHRSKLKLTIWFWALYFVTNDKRGHSALSIAQILDLNYRTAWRLLHKIRHAMAERDSNYILSDFIEMDDAFFGAPHSKTDGRGTGKTTVAIALSTDKKGNPLYVRIRVIEAVTSNEIKKFASENVNKGSKITTDGYTPYRQLKEDYIHKYQNYYESKDTNFLKYLHIVIGNAKAFITGTYHGLEEKRLQSYLDEFCYRFNRRFNTKQLFGRVLNACILGKHYVVPA